MNGWMPDVRHKETAAKGGYGIADGTMSPDAVVMHTAEGWLSTLNDWADERPARHRASYHFAIALNGDVTQYVPIRTPAWHAGRLDASRPLWPLWRPGVSPNAHTIGVSAEGAARADMNPNNLPLAWTRAQVSSAVEVLKWIAQETGIRLDERTLTEHSQIAVTSRFDPGPRWPKSSVLSRVGTVLSPPLDRWGLVMALVKPGARIEPLPRDAGQPKYEVTL